MTVIDFMEYKKKKDIEKVSDSMPEYFQLDDGVVAQPIVYTIRDDNVYLALRTDWHDEILFMKVNHSNGLLDNCLYHLSHEEIQEFNKILEEEDFEIDIE